MKHAIALVLACCALINEPAAAAPQAIIHEVMTKEFKDITGKEGVMLVVEYPPSGADAIHRHGAHAFVYVLEGEVEMQLRGGSPVKLRPGQAFYEGPDDVHIVGRNTSSTKRAKFVAFLVKNKGVPAFVLSK